MRDEEDKADEDELARSPRTTWTVAARLIVGFAIVAGVSPSFADALRVTSWNLQSLGADSTEGTSNAVRQWAPTLTKLNPDVILLQGVNDWKMCAQLAQALKPAEFNIAICSSFRPAQGQVTGRRQVAILSKQKAYFSWSEAWHNSGETAGPGGFTFAALQTGKVRVGLFCAELSAGADPQAQVRPLLDQLDAIKHWEMNQVQSFVVAVTFGDLDRTASAAREETVRLLEEAGFVDPLLQLPARQRITFTAKAGQPGVTADYLLVEPSIFPSPQILTTAGSHHNPVTCDLEFDSAKAAVAWTERARQAELLSQAQAARSQPPAAAEGSAADGSSLAARFGDTGLVWLVALAGIVLGFVALVVALTKNRKRVPVVPVLKPPREVRLPSR
jgi:hypothetical protein